MPVPMLQSFAKRSPKHSLKDAERYWEEAKIIASEKFDKKDDRYWAYVAAIVKRRMGIVESISFKNFLVESETGSKKFVNHINKIWLQVKKECHQFLTESNGLPLLRGSRSDREFNKYKTLNYRSSVDTSNLNTILFNGYIEHQFGIKNIRSENCLFTTGSAKHASGYGDTNLIFPCDGYRYVWSPNIIDLYESWAVNWISRQKSLKYSHKQLVNAMDKLTEKMSRDGLMRKSPSLDMIEVKYEEFKIIKQVLFNSLDKLQYIDVDLSAALKLSNEIIVKTKDYYSLSALDMLRYLHLVKPQVIHKDFKKMYTLFLEVTDEI